MENIFLIVLGIVCIIIGITHRKGNISLLHYYHRKRVSEEDRVPFGKIVGLGTIIIGIALISMGCLSFLTKSLQESVYSIIGSVVLIVGLSAGLGINFYGIIKFNKGIF